MAAPEGVQMELNNMKIRLINVYTHFDLATFGLHRVLHWNEFYKLDSMNTKNPALVPSTTIFMKPNTILILLVLTF